MRRALAFDCVLALAAAAMLCALPAGADEVDQFVTRLTGHLTPHGKDIVGHEARLVETGDVSFSGLKDDLREACKTAQECLRVHGTSPEDVQTAISLLVARRTDQDLTARIEAMRARNDRLHRLSDELRDARDHKDIDRLKKEIDRLNQDSQLSMIDMQTLIDKRNEAHQMLTDLLNKQQRALDSIIQNMR